MITLFLFVLMLKYNLTAMLGSIPQTNTFHSTHYMENTHASALLVREFLTSVRSGKNPEKARDYMAARVLAHQLNSENPQTVERTPEEYAEHVKEFLRMYGRYEFEITELIAEGNKVYARWKQTGTHLTTLDSYPATNQPIVEIASAVYRIEKGKIVEYWIQIDRLGLSQQLSKNTTK